jgi:hypothetical protein
MLHLLQQRTAVVAHSHISKLTLSKLEQAKWLLSENAAIHNGKLGLENAATLLPARLF